eukprot:TRINITY_DN19_c0_g1_i1.p1 TRINITY_DN19_c0_g1~~TRINITY_DN19_c0_g1_i1.p1  ORF type:complete len:100 (-),score=21.39 TRINITY_DN19_c0_g1_i1:513-812(-)
MNQKAAKLKAKIEKLNQQLKYLEDKQEKSIAKLVKDTAKKGMDIPALTGMILNSQEVFNAFENKIEAWRQAGEKFLFGAKNKSASKKDTTVNSSTNQTQ